MSEGRAYDILDLSADVRGDGVGMWIDGDGVGELTVTAPDAPGEVPTDEPVIWVTLERQGDGKAATMSGFVPLSEFRSLVEWAEGFE